MDDEFDKWIIRRFKPTINHGLLHFSYSSMKECWKAAIESTKESKIEFGCFNGNHHPISNYCALDDNDDKDFCWHAIRLYEKGRSKTDCEFWRPRNG